MNEWVDEWMNKWMDEWVHGWMMSANSSCCAADLKSLLICMETSRHGCNPTIQLGNAVVMSLFIWFGLSCLYRVLAVLIAPSIQFKHCVSMTGYSFFAWNLAILGSFPLENYHDLLKVPSVVPLVLFGVPSSLAQVRRHCVRTHPCY